MAEFEAFPKIPRLNRDIVITEKIDGTNAAVLIEAALEPGGTPSAPGEIAVDGLLHRVSAQSRKRLITPESDNFGFARWVYENAEELVRLMGPGRHFGEWWGQGIQRGYGQQRKIFSLFNPTFRWGLSMDESPLRADHIVDTVPVLYEGPFLERNEANGELPHQEALWQLRNLGSEAAPGFMDPEGIMIFHSASRSIFKVTLKDDEKPKGSKE